MAHQVLSLIGQAPGCSNRGNHFPLASPWRLAPFCTIKIFLGAATMGIASPWLPPGASWVQQPWETPSTPAASIYWGHPHLEKKYPAPWVHFCIIRYICIYPFNKHIFGYKYVGEFLKKQKKTKKKRKSRGKKSKIPAFFCWDRLQGPR